jgi:hypothetical protein
MLKVVWGFGEDGSCGKSVVDECEMMMNKR